MKTGDAVQTPFGKGTVREVRNQGRLLVDVQGRALLMAAADVSPLEAGRRTTSTAEPATRYPERQPASVPTEIDLHGLTVADALARAEGALNDGLLASHAELRFIHGRSGGKIRAALHRLLKASSSVRAFRVDPRNEGVTIVSL